MMNPYGPSSDSGLTPYVRLASKCPQNDLSTRFWRWHLTVPTAMVSSDFIGAWT